MKFMHFSLRWLKIQYSGKTAIYSTHYLLAHKHIKTMETDLSNAVANWQIFWRWIHTSSFTEQLWTNRKRYKNGLNLCLRLTIHHLWISSHRFYAYLVILFWIKKECTINEWNIIEEINQRPNMIRSDTIHQKYNSYTSWLICKDNMHLPCCGNRSGNFSCKESKVVLNAIWKNIIKIYLLTNALCIVENLTQTKGWQLHWEINHNSNRGVFSSKL